ncbi:hypothetical protein DAPPUDRAFT_279655, partial [Daphnia pulex]
MFRRFESRETLLRPLGPRIVVAESAYLVDRQKVHEIGLVLDRFARRSAQILSMTTGTLDLDERRPLDLLEPDDGLLDLLVAHSCLGLGKEKQLTIWPISGFNINAQPAYLLVAAAESYLTEREGVARGIGRLTADRVMRPVVEDDVLKILAVALAHARHAAHVHEHAAVAVQANDLAPALVDGDAERDGRRVAHAAHGQEVSLVALVLAGAVLEELARQHAGRSHDDIT